MSRPIALGFHGVRFEEAWQELAGRLGIVSVFDPSVSAADLDARLRVDARHLNGAQALRWVARLAGLVAIERQGVWLVARPPSVPRAWRKGQPRPQAIDAGIERLRSARHDRRTPHADIDWLDAPLSRVARDVAEGFGMDVLFAPEVQANQPMLTATLPGAGLEAVVTQIERQLSARGIFWDGVLWVQPAAAPLPVGASISTRESRASKGDESVTAPSQSSWMRSSSIHIDQDQDSWPKLAERLAGPDRSVRLEISPGHADPGMVARGTPEEILTAAALLGRLDYAMLPGGPEKGRTLVIRIAPH